MAAAASSAAAAGMGAATNSRHASRSGRPGCFEMARPGSDGALDREQVEQVDEVAQHHQVGIGMLIAQPRRVVRAARDERGRNPKAPRSDDVGAI